MFKLLAIVLAIVFAIWFEWFILPLEMYINEPALETAFLGKAIVITGGSQGIGKAIAKECVKLGIAQILIASRSLSKLENVKRELQTLAGDRTKIFTYAVDLSSEENCKKLITFCETQMGSVDYLVLNHITDSRYGLWTTDNAQLPGGHSFLSDMFKVNTFSYIWLATAALDTLTKSGGHISVVSSLAGHVGVPNTAVYSSTKHALHGFFNALRVELRLLGNDNVGITLCAIGATDTEGAKEVMKKMGSAVTWESPDRAAVAILRGAVNRKREIFHPHYLVFPATVIYNIGKTYYISFRQAPYPTSTCFPHTQLQLSLIILCSRYPHPVKIELGHILEIFRFFSSALEVNMFTRLVNVFGWV